MKTITFEPTVFQLIDSLQRQLQDEPEEQEKPQWLSPQQVADELGMHINTIYRFIQDGQFPVYDLTVGRKGKTYYRIRRDDFEAWLYERRRGTTR